MSLNPMRPEGVPEYQPPKKVPEAPQKKLHEVSIGKLARTILSSKMRIGEDAKTNLGTHSISALEDELGDKRVFLSAREKDRLKHSGGKAQNWVVHAFERFKNAVKGAGFKKNSDLITLAEAKLDQVSKPISGFENVYLVRGNIAEKQFADEKVTVAVNAANPDLEWGRGGTNRAFSNVIPRDQWESVHGQTYKVQSTKIKVGEALVGPQIKPGFTLVQALGPRLDARTEPRHLAALQKEVFNAYNNALKRAGEQGAKCVQLPQLCTGSFMKDASDAVKHDWPRLVNAAFLAAVLVNKDRGLEVAMVIPEGAQTPDFKDAAHHYFYRETKKAYDEANSGPVPSPAADKKDDLGASIYEPMPDLKSTYFEPESELEMQPSDLLKSFNDRLAAVKNSIDSEGLTNGIEELKLYQEAHGKDMDAKEQEAMSSQLQQLDLTRAAMLRNEKIAVRDMKTAILVQYHRILNPENPYPTENHKFYALKEFVESEEYAQFLKVEHVVDEKRITSTGIGKRLAELEIKAADETF